MIEDSRSVELTTRDRNWNALRAGLQLIPGVGPAMDRLWFGNLDEVRQRRWGDTLNEVYEILSEQDKTTDGMEGEEFANLNEQIGVNLGRATNEDKRKWFRNLLVNAAQLPPGDPNWESARIAGNLLEKLNAPSLAVLAALNWAKKIGDAAKDLGVDHFLTFVVREPTPRVEFRDDTRKNRATGPGAVTKDLGYEWVVVHEAVAQVRELELGDYSGIDDEGSYWNLRVEMRGRFLIDWALGKD